MNFGIYYMKNNASVAQLVERLLAMQEVSRVRIPLLAQIKCSIGVNGSI